MAAVAPTPAAATLPLLELRDIDAGYGAFRALFGISLRLAPGAVLALLGSNGSGKTTIARVCSGLITPTRGQVVFEGVDVTGWRAYKYAQLGIVHAPEGRSVFASLTVEENLELTFRRTRGRNGCRDALEEAYELFPRLGERRTQQAGTLSGGEQRMLSLSRVLVEKPRMLIADELSLGLAPLDRRRGVPNARDDSRLGNHAAPRRAARAPRAGHRRRGDRVGQGRSCLLRPGLGARRPAVARARRDRRGVPGEFASGRSSLRQSGFRELTRTAPAA